MKKIHNYSAGPCILPQEVLKKASDSILDFNGMGLSLIEISHRSKQFIEVMENARSLVKELLGVPDGYSVVFLQGGASLGFYMTALNYMKEGGKSAYANTGVWSTAAIKEAKKAGNVHIAASSEDKAFTYIPQNFDVPSDSEYFHITSNNTIYGTQYKKFPKTNVPLICDMSSDIFSRKVNVSDFAMIYGGAQKNMGPAGATVYIVKDELLGKSGRNLPAMLDLKLQIEKESMYNTPPVFAVYVCMLTLEWLKSLGGVAEIEKRNDAKAHLLYAEIDANPMFVSSVVTQDRSHMNVTFKLQDETKKEAFDKLWKANNISGIEGYRTVGGYRASMYNALPLESVQVLVDVMKEFANTNG
jgi:phosphoserine aminotransferase